MKVVLRIGTSTIYVVHHSLLLLHLLEPNVYNIFRDVWNFFFARMTSILLIKNI